MAYRTIYLIRHGQYDPEVEEKPLGSRLTEVGKEQSKRTAEFLSGIPLTGIHSSTSTRAVETAGYIAARHPYLKLQQSDLLREITPPLPYLALKHLKDIKPEKIREDQRQAEAAFSKYFIPAGEDDEYEAIVCHGNVIRYFICRILQVSPLIWMNFEIYNCSISAVEIDIHGSAILLSYNESGHLPEELKTQNLSPMGVGRKYAQTDTAPEPAEEKPS